MRAWLELSDLELADLELSDLSPDLEASDLSLVLAVALAGSAVVSVLAGVVELVLSLAWLCED